MRFSPKALFLAVLTGLVGVGPALAAPSPSIIEAKVALESAAEKRLDAVLQRMLGSDNVIAIVNVQLIHENQTESADDVLPGVPTKDSPGTPAPLEISSNLVRRITATVYLDKGASDADAKLVGDTVGRMLGLNSQRGDSVSVERITFQNPATAAKSGKRIPDGLISALWLVMAGILLLLLQRFTGPFLDLIKDAVESFKARAVAPRPQREEAEKEQAGPEQAGAAAAAPMPPEVSGRKRPFAFVEERDMPSLKLLLGHQDIETTAVVLQFLPPAMASEILAGLPPVGRKQVVAMMSKPAVLDEGEVTGIEDTLRTQLDYLMGGEEKLLALVDTATPSLQAAILEDVGKSDPALAQRLSKRLVMLEDLMLLDDAGFKTLGRAIPMQSLAAAIQSSPALRQSVLARLHGGLAEWLSQEVELMGALPPAVLEERKRQVVSALTRLVREGRVSLNKGRTPPPPAPSAAKPAVSAPPSPAPGPESTQSQA